MSKLTAKSVDRTGKKCTKCKKGKYHETTQMDDMDGVLHCTNCNHRIDRWSKTVKEEIANSMGNSSPQGGGNIAMPERLLGFNAGKGKRLKDILMRRPPGVKGNIIKQAMQKAKDKGVS